jgi:predicted alpha/beta hydrolase family esterase
MFLPHSCAFRVAQQQYCRNNLTAWHGGDNLVRAVASQNSNTIVVVHSVGPLIVEPWIDHPNVTAVSNASPSLSWKDHNVSILDAGARCFGPAYLELKLAMHWQTCYLVII